MEIKKLSLDEVEVKVGEEGMRFSGYASVFGGVDSYGDTIDPKAYEKTLKRKKGDRPIRLRWNHFGPVIGKWVELRTDERGLYVEGELTPGHSKAADVFASLRHGAVDGLSIGFRPKKVEMIDSGQRRLLKEIELIEISVVEDPADLGARISDVKSALDQAESLKNMESLLRDACGLSRTDATALVSRIRDLAHGERAAEAKAAADLSALFDQHHFG